MNEEKTKIVRINDEDMRAEISKEENVDSGIGQWTRDLEQNSHNNGSVQLQKRGGIWIVEWTWTWGRLDGCVFYMKYFIFKSEA